MLTPDGAGRQNIPNILIENARQPEAIATQFPALSSPDRLSALGTIPRIATQNDNMAFKTTTFALE